MYCFKSLSAVLLLSLYAIRCDVIEDQILLASTWKTQLLPMVDPATHRVAVLLQLPPTHMNLSQLKLHLMSEAGDEFTEDILLSRDLTLINGTNFCYHNFSVPSTNKPCITTYTLTVRGYVFHNGSYCRGCKMSKAPTGCYFKVGSRCEPRCTEVDSQACPLPPDVAANVKALEPCQQQSGVLTTAAHRITDVGCSDFAIGAAAAAAAAVVAATVAVLCFLRARFLRRRRVRRIVLWVSQELLEAPPPPTGLLDRLRLQNPLLPLLQHDI